MNTKGLKRIIILVFIIILIIVGLLIFLLNSNKTEEKPDYQNEVENKISDKDEKTNKETYISKENLGILENCIKQYLDTINMKNPGYCQTDEKGNDILIVDQKTISNKVYNLLSENYITQNSITPENALENTKKITDLALYTIVEAKEISNSNTKIKSFAAHVIVQSLEKYKLLQNIYLLVNMDENNYTYSIEPLNDIKNIEEIKVRGNINNIEKNDDNEVSYSNMQDADIIRKYINIYKRIAFINPEFIYNRLDSAYKAKRFGTLDEFIEYLRNNYSNIESLNISKYLKNDRKEYVEYVCLDTKDNYMFINEKETMDYYFILDNHTIDTEDFIKKYDKAKNEEKVSLNIKKIFDAINTVDYTYIYNKLDETFKNNNYDTFDKFKQYVNENIYKNCNIEYIDYSVEGNTYIYKIKMTSKENQDAKEKQMIIVMQLKENRDFVMSFSME